MRVLAVISVVFMVGLAFVFGMNYENAPSPARAPHAGGQEASVATAVEAASTTPAEATIPESTQPKYAVLKVVDGDTIVLDIDGKSTTIRLIGLDTPETMDPRKPVQCFGKEASDKARELLAGTAVSIETDPSQGELDKYGRLLLYVYLPDPSTSLDPTRDKPLGASGTSFNEYMIAEGYAHEYTYNLPYKYQAEFKAAEERARNGKKGLWADNACAEESSRPPKAKTTVTPVPIAPSGDVECSKNTYNCSSFKTQAEAQTAFDACGGASNDVHKLDNDKDTVVCESLP